MFAGRRILKALAFESRGENKDGYDLFYLLRSYGSGINDVMASLGPLLGEPEAQQALDVLRRDFLDHHGIGARRVAEFLTGTLDDAIGRRRVREGTARCMRRTP